MTAARFTQNPEPHSFLQAPSDGPLHAAQMQRFARDGCLFVDAAVLWRAHERRLFLRHARQVERWGRRPGAWMRYLEADKRALNRIENFVPFSAALYALLAGGALPAAASQLLGGAALLHKDKINYKLPGGDGFAPHQDVAAGWGRYGQTRHLSAYIAIDPARHNNGPLEVVRGAQHRRWSPDDTAIDAATCAGMHWDVVLAAPCDVFFFDSYVPHRSGANRSRLPRRACYCTYAKASEGDWRARYFADKRQSFPPDAERQPGAVYTYKI